MYTIQPYGSRYFAVYDPQGALVCVTLYKKGAAEVVRRLSQPGRVPARFVRKYTLRDKPLMLPKCKKI